MSNSVFTRSLHLTLLLLLGIASSVWADPTPDSEHVLVKPFGKNAQGEQVTLYTLANKNGMSVSIMDYGATIVKLVVPDRNGKLDDVVLGFDQFAPYLTVTSYFGATIGRYANRLAGGKFTVDKVTYEVPHPKGPNSLHGGVRGFDKRMWKFEPVESDVPAIRFSRLSPDGEEGFPGNCFVSVTFALTDDNRLRISYQATTDKTTVINLTNHSYFNLAGAGNGTILDHVLTLHANMYTPTDATRIPTGEIKDVTGTPWNFLAPTAMGLHLTEAGGKPIGFDQNYVLQKGFFSNWALAAEVYEPKTGRTMEVYTDQPGIQFYTGNHLDGKLIGKERKAYQNHGAFCLETQHYPDSPNHDNFPSTVLRPNQTFKSTTVYAFGVK